MACKIKETEDETTEKVVESLDKYINTYISEVIPESVVIDYDRIQQLEKTFSVLKESLLVTDIDVQKKMKQLDESTSAELEKTRKLLKEEVQKRIILENSVNSQESKNLLTEKLMDLPAYERKILKKKFSNSSAKEINESFDDALENIRKDLISECENSSVNETVVTETIDSSKANDKTSEVRAPVVDPMMAKYAELARRNSNYVTRK